MGLNRLKGEIQRMGMGSNYFISSATSMTSIVDLYLRNMSELQYSM